MDEIVLRALSKWPNVPAVYGWLSLDRRGNWFIKGEKISNPTVNAFIGRNYERDGEGRWFFQNGPQRVYVSLEYTPFVYRAMNGDDAPLRLECQTGARVTAVSGAWIDEKGALLLQTEHGLGLVHDRDLDRVVYAFVDQSGKPLSEDVLSELMQALQDGHAAALWLKHGVANIKVEPLRSEEVCGRFGFQSRPGAAENQTQCT
jgi:hypothetical protein